MYLVSKFTHTRTPAKKILPGIRAFPINLLYKKHTNLTLIQTYFYVASNRLDI